MKPDNISNYVSVFNYFLSFRKFAESYEDVLMTYEILRKDLSKCIDMAMQNPEDQTWQRLVIRLTFSLIDSMCYKLKNLILIIARGIFYPLSKDDNERLKEMKFDEKGKIKGTKYLSPLENIKFTFNKLSEICKANYAFPSKREARIIIDAAKLRNRITHPKSAEDLNIDPIEYQKVAEALIWFGSQFDKLILAINIKREQIKLPKHGDPRIILKKMTVH